MTAKNIKKIHYNKLIRDGIPIIMDEKGVKYKISRLPKKRFKLELLKKIGEESSALPKLKNKKDIVNELADVIAVIDELKKIYKITDRDIKIELKNNYKKKRGFNKKLFLHWSQDTGYRTNERRYSK